MPDLIDHAASTVLKVAGSLSNFFRASKSNSLTQFTAVARMEPVCVVEQSLITAPYMTEVMQTANTLLGVYYSQAFAIDNQIGSINLVRRLDKLSPNRSVSDAILNQPYYSPEDFQLALPKYVNQRTLSQEAYDGDKPTSTARQNTSTSFGRDLPTVLRSADNLAVGKVIEVTAQNGNEKATIPVNISIKPLLMEPAMMVETFGKGGFKNTRTGRWYRYRAGELETLRDMIGCRDLIDAHRAALVKDKTGFYAATREKRTNNRLAAIASGDPSVNTISNIAVFTTVTARELEANLGGSLNDYNIRQNMFNDSSLMLVFVIDQDREMCRIYYHGIKDSTLMRIADMKTVNKTGGSDLTEILRAFQQVNAPAF